jgi:alpha-tubulin suppressor-like RCC1 family protein
MAGNYSVQGADLDKIYMPTTTLIDRYVKTGSLWNWGYNTYGTLGANDITHRSSPVQTVSGGTNWTQVIGNIYNNAGIKTDGTLWLWGRADFGEMGNNNSGAGLRYSSPVQTVSGGTNWKQISGNGSFTIGNIAAIKTDGTLWLWGANSYGQLGDNSSILRQSPVQTVSGGNLWKTVAVGQAGTLAIKTDGTLWAWGLGSSGQRGDGTSTQRISSPVQTVSGGTNWQSVSAGDGHVGAIKTDGTLWTWGANNYGQLGNNVNPGGTGAYSSPVQTVGGGTNWKQVAAGYVITSAIKTDGTLWCWGKGLWGSLGNNGITHRSSPVQTVSGGTNWRQVATRTYLGVSAIKTDGTLWTWGANNYGQLGDNTTIDKSSPIQTVASGTNWKQVSGAAAIHFYDAYNLYPK